MQKNIFVILAVSFIVFIGIIFAGKNMRTNYVQAPVTQVCASHILVDTEEEANKILQSIQAHEISFEDAAKKFSKCPSRENGGDLGFFGRGVMVKEFEDVAFSAEEGEVSAPVQTQFGWHLIKVTGKK